MGRIIRSAVVTTSEGFNRNRHRLSDLVRVDRARVYWSEKLGKLILVGTQAWKDYLLNDSNLPPSEEQIDLTSHGKICKIKKILEKSSAIADSQEFGLSYGQVINCLEEIREVINCRDEVTGLGTNFFMFTPNKELKSMFGEKARVVDEPDFGYEIHIAKTSAGWQPVFEAHERIKCVSDIKALYDFGNVIIYDEYGQSYDWSAFTDRVLNFGSDDNWRACNNNDFGYYSPNEYTSTDGYRFIDNEFR